jgi:DNA-binding Lrp family transcriptional regulator
MGSRAKFVISEEASAFYHSITVTPSHDAKEKGEVVKDVELKLIYELIKNSRRSDRELARAIGTSQPTVSRMIKKLKKEGVIREYTMIPDFIKLGYKIMALTFCSLKELNPEEYEGVIAAIKRELGDEQWQKIIMFERGLGLESTAVVVSLHEDYSSYVEFIDKLKEYPFLEMSKPGSFLISLDDEVRYRPLTLSALANHVLQMKEKKE